MMAGLDGPVYVERVALFDAKNRVKAEKAIKKAIRLQVEGETPMARPASVWLRSRPRRAVRSSLPMADKTPDISRCARSSCFS